MSKAKEYFQRAVEDYGPKIENAQKRFLTSIDNIGTRASSSFNEAAGKYKAWGMKQGAKAAKINKMYSSTIGAPGRAVYNLGASMERSNIGAAKFAGKWTRRAGNTVTNPISYPLRSATKAPRKMVNKLRGGRRTIKSLPKSTRRLGLIGGIGLGITAMLGVSVLKGAMNQGRQIAYERYMLDTANTQGVISTTRLNRMSGSNRMINHGGTIGLSNALSRTRHG